MAYGDGPHGAFAIILHYTDDDDHAWRTWAALPEGKMPWDFREQIETVKRVAAETRIPQKQRYFEFPLPDVPC